MVFHRGVFGLFPLMGSVLLAIPAYLLAKEKDRNVPLWTVLGLIPGVNFLSMWFFVGAANLRLEKKLDALLGRGEGGASRG